MRVLFVHQNFPAQYLHIAPALARIPGNDVVALTMGYGAVPGVRTVRYQVSRNSTPGVHSLAGDYESKTIRGESAALTALRLKAEGFTPDVICGHPGWGETLFLKEVWPRTQLLSFVEFVYHTDGADVGFDPEFPIDDLEKFRVHAKNAAVYMSLAESDWLVAPTVWQAEQVPKLFRKRLSIIHDGIDTDIVKPNPNARIKLGSNGIELKSTDQVITFVNRNLEPYRGYHIFMRSLPEILRRRPDARVILVGGNRVSYGNALPEGQSYREKYLNEIKGELDMSRVHFVGAVPYPTFLNLLQISAAHVYLTYPFVLSWSMLEAMSAGCLVIGSATAPVQEVIRDGENGILVDFFSPTKIATAVIDALDNPQAYTALRQAARQTVLTRYDLKTICLPRHLEVINALARGHIISQQLY